MLPTKLLVFSLALVFQSVSSSVKYEDRVLYKNLGTLYFYSGRLTRARRTEPVPQLVCLQGCQYPQPQMVTCKNTGWDGNSNLWRCSAELDSAYALDKAEVVCEGYDSPVDPYVTGGSCSLEYSIKRKGGGNKDLGSEVQAPGLSGFFFILFCIFLIYVLAKTCLRSDDEVQHDRSSTNDDRPDDGYGPQMGWNLPGMNQRHRPGHYPDSGFMPRSDSCGNQGNAGGNGGGGGFWTGLATGGVLGYLFSGNRNTGYQNYNPSAPYHSQHSNQGYFSNWGSGSTSQSSGFFSSDSGSGSSSQSETTARYRQR